MANEIATPQMHTLESFHSKNIEFAKKRIIGSEETPFLAIGLSAQNELLYVLAPFTNQQEKESTLLFLSAIFQHENCPFYSVISECWVSRQPNNQPFKSPSLDPGKKDILVILSVDAESRLKHTQFEIKRQAGKAIDLLSAEELEITGGDMTRLLTTSIPRKLRRSLLKNWNKQNHTQPIIN